MLAPTPTQAAVHPTPPPAYLPPRTLSRREPSARRRPGTPWSQPSHVALARRVRVLDRFLGGVVEGVKDLLVVQSVILSRQECARRALESSDTSSPGLVGWN